MYAKDSLSRPCPTQALLPAKAHRTLSQERFCPSIFCFTGDITVQRLSSQAEVWLLTDERDGHSWVMMGADPVCPHCGTTLR